MVLIRDSWSARELLMENGKCGARILQNKLTLHLQSLIGNGWFVSDFTKKDLHVHNCWQKTAGEFRIFTVSISLLTDILRGVFIAFYFSCPYCVVKKLRGNPILASCLITFYTPRPCAVSLFLFSSPDHSPSPLLLPRIRFRLTRSTQVCGPTSARRNSLRQTQLILYSEGQRTMGSFQLVDRGIRWPSTKIKSSSKKMQDKDLLPPSIYVISP